MPTKKIFAALVFLAIVAAATAAYRFVPAVHCAAATFTEFVGRVL
jgi:hypothetical protein